MKGIELFKCGSCNRNIIFPNIINDFIVCNPVFYLEFLKLVVDESTNCILFNIPKIKVGDVLKPLEIVYHGNLEKREFVSIETFFAPSKLMPYEDENGNKFLAIASSEDNGRGGLLVGVEPSNCDMIYKYRWEESDLRPDVALKLSNNIFEFISEMETIPMWEKEYDRSNLVKSFNNSYYELRN